MYQLKIHVLLGNIGICFNPIRTGIQISHPGPGGGAQHPPWVFTLELVLDQCNVNMNDR